MIYYSYILSFCITKINSYFTWKLIIVCFMYVMPQSFFGEEKFKIVISSSKHKDM